MNDDIYEKVYGGWMGKIIGVIHGANIEGWTYEEIETVFGEISGYPFTFRNFCADDDINGPAFFQRAVLDYGNNPDSAQLGSTFLNYVSDGHGFFWWGGYGISTEDTAYHNLIAGIAPPLSGSAKLNGEGLANQIGGQIFSDCWGLACPGNEAKAAGLARKMAAVTHDREGVNGAGFIAAAIAAAFDASDVEEIVQRAAKMLPEGCAYAQMVEDVYSYTALHKEDWRTCFGYVKERYDYRFYPGVCHIIPNAAVIVLALICGQGSFDRTLQIAAMCGWDTDCNEGNLGTVLGVFNGIKGIGDSWLKQPGDLVICSGSVGSLNIQTVPQIAENTLRVSEILGEFTPDELWKRILSKPEGQYMHFQFPKSTHTLRARKDGNGPVLIENAGDSAYIGKRSLRVTLPAFGNTDSFALFYKPYYRPEDFDDNRYQPDLSPTLYPGDEICFHYRFRKEDIGKRILVSAFYKDRISGEKQEIERHEMRIESAEWRQGFLHIPALENVILEEAGIQIIGQDVARREQTEPFRLWIGDAEIFAHPSYRMDAKSLFEEKWTAVDTNPAGFSYLRGAAAVLGQRLEISGTDRPAEMYTGSRCWTDISITADMIPLYGERHYLLGRVQGGMRWYAAGLIRAEGKASLAILKKDGDISVMKQCLFPWKAGETYRLTLKTAGNLIQVFYEGKEMLAYEDLDGFYPYGCVGLGNQNASRTACCSYEIREALNGCKEKRKKER